MSSLQRFEDNPNGVITDKESPNNWLPKDAWGDLGRWVDWQEAESYLQTMRQVYAGGFNDWRMPTKEEALSLYIPELNQLDWEGKHVHIDTVFVGKCSSFIWTSDVNDEGQALKLNLRDGSFEYADKSLREHQSVRGIRVPST